MNIYFISFLALSAFEKKKEIFFGTETWDMM